MSTERRIVYSTVAAKALRKMDSKAAKLIRAKIGQLAADPASLAGKRSSLAVPNIVCGSVTTALPTRRRWWF